MSEYLSLYVSAPSHEVAAKIGRTLVEEQLAACVNIISGMQSMPRTGSSFVSSSTMAADGHDCVTFVAPIQIRGSEAYLMLMGWSLMVQRTLDR
jgi:hypothetical protein